MVEVFNITITYWNEKWLGNFVCEVMKHVHCLCGEGEVRSTLFLVHG